MFRNDLVGPAKRFVVSGDSTDTTFGPGSVGFISHIRGGDTDFPNLIYVAASVIRRGKTGKERLEIAELCIPLFDSNDDALKTFWPAENEKRKSLIRIEPPHSETTVNVSSMSDIEFLGWSNSVAVFLEKLLTSSAKIKSISPENQNELSRLVGLPERFGYDPNETKTEYCSIKSRLAIVKTLRQIEPTFSRCVAIYRKKVASMQLDIANLIINQKVVDDNNILPGFIAENRKTVLHLENAL